MKKIKDLIKSIEDSNLSEDEKKQLIEKLDKKEPDINGFIQLFISILKISKDIIEIFLK